VLPSISRRWAHVHPLTMLIGALAGVPYFGLLGLLIGPLALSYFFELINAYRLEYAGELPGPARRDQDVKGAGPPLPVLPVGAEIEAPASSVMRGAPPQGSLVLARADRTT
jgi:hypothetical protein